MYDGVGFLSLEGRYIMRTKKIFLLTALIIFVILSIFFMNSFLFPTLRCYRAQQLSVLEYDKSEYDSIIMAAYPSFNASNYILYDIILDEKGFVALAYVNKEPPLITDVGLDVDLDFLHVFRYDLLWNKIEQIS